LKRTIFYDRKHGCEVRADQLCFTNYVVTLARTQDDYEVRNPKDKTIDGSWELKLGELGYLPDDATDWEKKYRNFTRTLNYPDLVFLRFEDDYEEETDEVPET
jgi:hypothetical protein